MDEKIEFCASFYWDQGLPTVFKVTESSTPSNLDDRLETLGYRMDSPTSVQLLKLHTGNYEVMANVGLISTDSEEWHTAFARMNHVDESRRITHERILRAILPDKCYASVNENGHIIGCGLGVLQAGHLGIFDIVIDPDQRRRGYGTDLMNALLAWGQEAGANMAYLQVMCDNEPALRLYDKLGFQEKYQYWYRIKP